MDTYISIVLKLCGMGATILAACLWTVASLDARPKYREEQTFIGGTIWSQIIVPLGLVISQSINEELDFFVHAYFLVTGIMLCSINGVLLLFGEFLSMVRYRNRRMIGSSHDTVVYNYNKIYLTMGVLFLVADGFTIAGLVSLFLVPANEVNGIEINRQS